MFSSVKSKGEVQAPPPFFLDFGIMSNYHQIQVPLHALGVDVPM